MAAVLGLSLLASESLREWSRIASLLDKLLSISFHLFAFLFPMASEASAELLHSSECNSSKRIA